MIKLILKGGLGNQMFQYSAAYTVAKKNNYKLGLDLSFIKTRIPVFGFTVRDYELDLFSVVEPTFSLFNNQVLDKYLSYPIEKLAIESKLFASYTEKDNYGFDENVFNIGDNSYIEGYFNNHKYFERYESDIKKIFDTSKLYDKRFEEVEEKIDNCNSVSINIRRGDYLNAKHKDVFVFLDSTYYKRAIEKIKERVKDPHFFIFSIDFPENDDSYFVNELGLKKEEFTLLGKKYVGERFKTYLRLISLCKHNIMANSTFSFWGAYLNNYIEKNVICPSKWAYKASDFEVPSQWIQINI